MKDLGSRYKRLREEKPEEAVQELRDSEIIVLNNLDDIGVFGDDLILAMIRKGLVTLEKSDKAETLLRNYT